MCIEVRDCGNTLYIKHVAARTVIDKAFQYGQEKLERFHREHEPVTIGGYETYIKRGSVERFIVIDDHWYGGLHWAQIGDRQTDCVWFVNHDARQIRPWRNGDEKIHDKYTEVFECLEWEDIPHPTIEQVKQRFRDTYGSEPNFKRYADGYNDDGLLGFLIHMALFNESIPTEFNDVCEFARWRLVRPTKAHIQVQV